MTGFGLVHKAVARAAVTPRVSRAFAPAQDRLGRRDPNSTLAPVESLSGSVGFRWAAVRRRARPPRYALAAGLLLVLFTTFGTASVAVASVPLPTEVPGEDAAGPIEDVVDAVEDVVDTVEDVAEPVEDVEDAAQPVEDAADPVVDTVNDVLEDPVTGVTDAVTRTLDDATDPVKDALDGDTGGTVGSGLGGNSQTDAPTFRGGERGSGALGSPSGNEAVDSLRRTAPGATDLEVDPTGASTQPGSDSSVLEDVATTITEAAKRLAFPLALALVVLAFLSAQGQVDRKDPKLALAPVDSFQEYMSFR